jgi:hypothetical protein
MVALGQLMAQESSVGLVDTVVQVAPPSVVTTIPPDSWARQVVVLGQLILVNPFW